MSYWPFFSLTTACVHYQRQSSVSSRHNSLCFWRQRSCLHGRTRQDQLWRIKGLSAWVCFWDGCSSGWHKAKNSLITLRHMVTGQLADKPTRRNWYMDVSAQAHGSVFSALGRCGPTLVVSTKAYKAVFRLASFWRKKKTLYCRPILDQPINRKRYLFTGL